MVFGINPECSKCKTTAASMWQKEGNQIYCQDCFKSHLSKTAEIPIKEEEAMDVDVEEKKESQEGGKGKSVKEEEDNETSNKEKESINKVSDKKESKRKTRKGRQGGKGTIPKGKGRRFIFKKSATKAPVAVSTPVTSDYVYYKETYYQIGDIVSVIDLDGGTYYAQIRGLLQDQYCEKSAVITWLLPTKKSPPPEEKFDPSTYIIGPEEDVPRKLEYVHFVCHAPSDYFKDRSSPYATVCYKPQSCYVWSKMGPVIRPIENQNELIMK